MEKISLDTKSDSNLQFDLHHSKMNEVFGLIQISHGMAEHKGRYTDFINYFNRSGYHVAIYDHRGHGESILDNKIGFFGLKNGWDFAVDDLLRVHQETVRLFPNIKKILLGHSMGSWIGLSALEKDSLFNGVLLSGSSYPNFIETILQRVLLRLEILRLGRLGYSQFLHKIIFGGFNAKFSKTLTPNDWLSRDILSVKNYTNDQLCGFVVSNQLWFDVIHGIGSVFKKKNLKLLNNEIPYLVFSGTNDPVGGMGKGTKKLHECLLLNNCESQLYLVEGARHETLNETDKMTTYNYILTFLDKNL